MAKKPSIVTVSSGYQGTTTINSNFQALRDAFDNTISRDGSTPNAMDADLDMNSKDILNVKSLSVNGLFINGQVVEPGTINYNGVIKETQVATAGQTVFNLTTVTYTPGINNLSVYVDGEYQNFSNYSETNPTSVTFFSGLTLGAIVDFVVISINSLSGTADATNVTYIPQGAGATTTTVSNKLKETISVKDFGAIGDGVTDNTTAFQNAFNYANSLGGCTIYIPPGRYRKADTAGSRWIMYSNTTLMGAGASSVIFFDDKDTVARSGNDMLYFNNVTNIAFDNFKIEGTALVYTNETNQKQCLTGENVVGLRVTNLIIEKLRYMATAFGYATNVYMSGNQLDYIVRDGLRTVASDNVIITNNILRRVTDDCIAVHSLDAETVPGAGVVISNNVIEACQGIKVLGAKFVTVTGNVLRRCLRGPIDIDIPATGVEGNTHQFSIDVSNNNISDTFGNLGINYTIFVRQNIGKSAGGLGTFPGVNSIPYAYNYNNNIDSGTPVILGQFGIRIANNTINRTLPDGVLYSSWGYGEMFDRNTTNFISDPTVTSTYFQTHGIVVTAPITSMQISGNNISGTGTGFSAILMSIVGSTNRQDYSDTVISYNNIIDCPGAGINLSTLGSGSGAKQIVITNNVFDLDPYFRATSHNSDNTWTSATALPAIYTVNTIGILAGGNSFKNCSESGLNSGAVEELYPNIVYSDFAGSFDNSSNKGVRFLPAANSNIIIPINGDPTSTTFNQIANSVLVKASAKPTTGRYVAGHFVKAVPVTVSGSGGSQYIITGWLRLTTGSGHTLNTDWSEIRCLTGT